MKRLSSKIFLGYLSVITLLTTLVLFISYSTISTYYFDDLLKNLTNLNLTFQYQAIDLVKDGNTSNLDSLAKVVGKATETRITIIDKNGKVLGDSDFDPKLMDDHLDRPEIKEALSQEVGKSTRFSETVEGDMYYVAIPLIINDEVFGVTRVSVYTSAIYELLHLLRADMIEVSVVVMIITLIGVLILTRRITRPINQLSVAAASVASGDFDYQVKVSGDDEITLLSKNFNQMTQKLKHLFIEVDSQREELRNIISSIDEGFVVLNASGRILLSNQKFNELVDTESLEGIKIKKIIKDKALKDLYKETVKTEKSITTEILVKNRSLLASSNYIESKKEIAILFHDITDLKQFEQIKKDFVINVSHELRTPLTAIKGFVETLDSEITDNESVTHYIKIISRHTNRLIELVQDLLTLSELEDGGTKIVASTFEINSFLSNIVKIFEQKLKDKVLAIKLEISPKIGNIDGDRFRLEQLFINLIDNAIKYTDIGFITIFIEPEENNLKIVIEDTGIGIPKEDLDRIFERFYLVNKSRTRKEGGTGLGLSIVKHIVLQHDGKIEVESEIGVGTKFFINLPILGNEISEKNEELKELKNISLN